MASKHCFWKLIPAPTHVVGFAAFDVGDDFVVAFHVQMPWGGKPLLDGVSDEGVEISHTQQAPATHGSPGSSGMNHAS